MAGADVDRRLLCRASRRVLLVPHMSVGYRLGLSFLMDGWNPSETRWADFLRFLATEVGATTLRNHDQLDAAEIDGVSHRIFVFRDGSVRVIGPGSDDYAALANTRLRRGSW